MNATRRHLLATAIAVLSPIRSLAADEGVIFVEKLDPTLALARRAVQIALPVFEQRGPNIENYQTLVYLFKSAEGTPLRIGVLFRDPDTPGGMRGSSEEYPSYEVNLNSDATLVIGSHSSR